MITASRKGSANVELREEKKNEKRKSSFDASTRKKELEALCAHVQHMALPVLRVALEECLKPYKRLLEGRAPQ